MNIGTTIKTLRQIRSLSQTKLADAVGIERPYLSAIEKGHSQPSLKLLRELAAHLRIPPALMLLGEGDPQDPVVKNLQSMWGMILTIKAQEAASVPSHVQKAKPAHQRASSASPRRSTRTP